MDRVLIIESGIYATRLHQAYQNLGYETVAIYYGDNNKDTHLQIANIPIQIPKEICTSDFSAFYIFIKIALETNSQFIHPGTGSLASNYYFTRACEDHGIFILGNLSDSIEKMNSSEKNIIIGELHSIKKSNMSTSLNAQKISKINKFQLIYASNLTDQASYIGSMEFYKRQSQSKNIYVSSPCQSVQVDDFINLNRQCRKLISLYRLFGVICFTFRFNGEYFFIDSIETTINSFALALEERLNIDLIEMQADIFINGKIKYIQDRSNQSLSKNIFTVNSGTVKKINYSGGCHINHYVNAYEGKNIFPNTKKPLAVVSAYGKYNLIDKLMQATHNFHIETIALSSTIKTLT